MLKQGEITLLDAIVILLLRSLRCQILLEDCYLFQKEMLTLFFWCSLGGREEFVNQLTDACLFLPHQYYNLQYCFHFHTVLVCLLSGVLLFLKNILLFCEYELIQYRICIFHASSSSIGRDQHCLPVAMVSLCQVFSILSSGIYIASGLFKFNFQDLITIINKKFQHLRNVVS